MRTPSSLGPTRREALAAGLGALALLGMDRKRARADEIPGRVSAVRG